MSKVSIIVPCWGVEKYLDRCVNSLVNQTLQDIEIILVDDESPDRVPEMCDEWAEKDSRIKVVHKINGGLGLACNSGIDVATGEYVAFCDSDDYVDEEMYDTMLKAAEANEAEVVFTGLKRVDDFGHITSMEHIANKRVANGRCEVDEVMLDMIASEPSDPVERHLAMSAKVVLYKRDILTKYNIRFESERKIISEDLIFNLDVLSRSEHVVVLPNRFYNYYVNTQSLTTKARIDRFDKTKEMRDILLKRYSFEKKSDMFLQRINRWFIGYNRTDIKIICKSNNLTMKNKWKLINDISKDSIWGEIYEDYPVKLMPIIHRTFFLLTKWNRTTFVMILAYLR